MTQALAVVNLCKATVDALLLMVRTPLSLTVSRLATKALTIALVFGETADALPDPVLGRDFNRDTAASSELLFSSMTRKQSRLSDALAAVGHPWTSP